MTEQQRDDLEDTIDKWAKDDPDIRERIEAVRPRTDETLRCRPSVNEAFPPCDQLCGYCGSTEDVRYAGADYPICITCRRSRGQEPLEDLLDAMGFPLLPFDGSKETT